MKKILIIITLFSLVNFLSCDSKDEDIFTNNAFISLLANAGIKGQEDIKAVIKGFNEDIEQTDSTYLNLSANEAKRRIYLYHAYSFFLKYTANLVKYENLTQTSYSFNFNALTNIDKVASNSFPNTQSLSDKYVRIYPALIFVKKDGKYKFSISFVIVLEDKNGTFISSIYNPKDSNNPVDNYSDTPQIQITDQICPNAPNCPPKDDETKKIDYSKKLINEDSIKMLKSKK